MWRNVQIEFDALSIIQALKNKELSSLHWATEKFFHVKKAKEKIFIHDRNIEGKRAWVLFVNFTTTFSLCFR